MHPFLCRNDAGDVRIHWPRLVWSVAVFFLIAVIANLMLRRFLGVPFSATNSILSIAVYVLSGAVWLYFAKRRAQGESAKQFSLAALLAGLTVACCLLAIVTLDRRSDLQKYATRQRLQQIIMMLVVTGDVHVSETTSVQVKRPSFDDDDLKKILELKPELDRVGSPLTIFGLSGTSVTDRGIGELATLDSLEYCFLERTAITDAAIDAFTRLPNLKMLSVWSTSVTAERLWTLNTKRPQLDIEPTTYQKLKSP
jgi:hypothetical protein